MPLGAGVAVGEALVVEAAPTLGVEATCDVDGAAVVLRTGVCEDVLEVEVEVELLVGCVSDVVLGAAESVESTCSVVVGAEDSVGFGSGVGVAFLVCEVAIGAPT